MTQEQAADLLDRLDFYGTNGWAKNPRTALVMPTLLGGLEKADMPMAQVKEAMESIGYGKG